jgi:hypothetical protein
LQDNRFRDNSTNAFAITTAGTPQTTPYWYPGGFTTPSSSLGAAYFNGTTDYLSLTNSSALQLTNTTAFTIEFWVYLFNTTGYPTIINGYKLSDPYQGFGIRATSTVSNTFEFWD